MISSAFALLVEVASVYLILGHPVLANETIFEKRDYLLTKLVFVFALLVQLFNLDHNSPLSLCMKFFMSLLVLLFYVMLLKRFPYDRTN